MSRYSNVNPILLIIFGAMVLFGLFCLLYKRFTYFKNARRYTNKLQVENVYRELKNILNSFENTDGKHYRNMILLALGLIIVPTLIELYFPSIFPVFSNSLIAMLIVPLCVLAGIIIVVVSGLKFGSSKYSHNIASYEVEAIDKKLSLTEEIEEPLSLLPPFVQSTFVKTTCNFRYNNNIVYAGKSCTQVGLYKETIDFNGLIIKSMNKIPNGTINISNISTR